MARWFPRLCSLLALLLVVAVGCTKVPSGVVPKGKLSNAGQPLTVKPMVGMLEMHFYNMDELATGKAVDPQSAQFEKDGTFSVPGTMGDGLKPGKYKVTVLQYDEYPNKEVLQGKFNLQNTKIIRDVQVGMPDLNIDVSKPEG